MALGLLYVVLNKLSKSLQQHHNQFAYVLLYSCTKFNFECVPKHNYLSIIT